MLLQQIINMSKLRLYLGNIGETRYGNIIKGIFICKKIKKIIIDGKKYYKNDYKNDSINTQHFYKNIIKNNNKISYIKYVNQEFFLKNKKLHNLFGFAFIIRINGETIGHYYINGLKLSKKEFLLNKRRKILLRKHKLNKILNN